MCCHLHPVALRGPLTELEVQIVAAVVGLAHLSLPPCAGVSRVHSHAWPFTWVFGDSKSGPSACEQVLLAIGPPPQLLPFCYFFLTFIYLTEREGQRTGEREGGKKGERMRSMHACHRAHVEVLTLSFHNVGSGDQTQIVSSESSQGFLLPKKILHDLYIATNKL